MTTIRKLWSMLLPQEKLSAVGLIGLMLVSMLLEMLGVGIVVPALSLMAGDRLAHPPAALRPWLNRLGNPPADRLILYGLVGLLALYAVKAAYLLYANWMQSRFIARLENRISGSLFSVYLNQPWTFHLQRNSSELVRNLADVYSLAYTAATLLGALAEMLVVAGIMGLLLWFEPAGAVAVGSLMASATWFIDWMTKARLVRWGNLAQHHGGLGYKHMYQGLCGAKDVKVLGCEDEFVAEFAKHRSAYVKYKARQSFFGSMPRLWYELLAVSGLCLLTVVMVWQGKQPQAMIPTLGLFAAAAFRILPSVNRLSFALQSLRSTTGIIDTIDAELRLAGQTALSQGVALPVSFSNEIEVQNVGFRYDGAPTDAVSDIAISIPHGHSVGIIGGSGAGKSTLVDIMLGLLTPTRGRVTVDGVDVQHNLRGWQSLIGYVPQTIFLCDDTIRRNVAFGIREDRIDDRAVDRAIRAAQLQDFIAGLPDGINTLVGEQGVRLSGGQRQRIGIARALYHDPQLLVLDEATSALDTETERGVMEAVESLHGAKTLVIIAHRLSTVAHCDTLYRLDRGRVTAHGAAKEMLPSGA